MTSSGTLNGGGVYGQFFTFGIGFGIFNGDPKLSLFTNVNAGVNGTAGTAFNFTNWQWEPIAGSGFNTTPTGVPLPNFGLWYDPANKVWNVSAGAPLN